MHHVSINVADVDDAVRFYVDTLGLSVRKDRPDFGFGGVWLDAGGQQVHLIESQDKPARGQHFALLVGDLGEVVIELRDKGVKVSDPQEVGASLQSFVRDPSGNLVELHERR